MSLFFHDTELKSLMEDFFMLSGMRIVLFDENFNELTAYPTNREYFCSCMRENEDFDKKCRECDEQAFIKCRQMKSLYIYKCHAGLVEAIAPITENSRIIGYMVFGQITDDKNKTEITTKIEMLLKEYKIKSDLKTLIKKIKYRNNRQILAASKIMDACTGYIQLKEIVHPSGKQLIKPIESFIDTHIDEEITINRLCDEFNISRTRLYDIMHEYIDGGIAAFIRKKRLQHAKQLLKNNDMTIAEISDAVGFSDYNYFLRVFKKEFGISPKKFLNLLKNK